MTATSLATALIVGLLIGTLGHSVIPRGRVPFWVSLGVGTGAVLLGSIVAGIAGIGVAEFSIAELVIQIVFGASGIALVAGTADRQPSDGQDRPARSAAARHSQRRGRVERG